MAVLLALLAGCAAAGSEDEAPESEADELAGPPHIAAGIELTHRREAPAGAAALEKQSRSVHFGNAYWLGKLSILAYENAPEVLDELRAWGFDAASTRIFENRCSGGFAVYVPIPRGAVLVFRGTEPSWADWQTDLASFKVPWEGAGTVHQGFLERFHSLWHADPACGLADDLAQLIRVQHGGSAPGGALYLTGHSMGAALATLTLGALQRAVPPIQPSALYTYGSPRVGNEAFSYGTADAARDRTAIFRFVNGHDVVPSIPTDLDPLEALVSNYRHLGDHDGADEYELEVWIEDQRLELGTSHSLYSYDDHLGYLAPLEFQARVHNQLH